MYKRRQIGLITSILLLHGCSQGEEEYAGRVIRILDGHTIVVLHNRSPERIRLAEIDAPENSQPLGAAAYGIVVFDGLDKVGSHLLLSQMDRYFNSLLGGRHRKLAGLEDIRCSSSQ